MNTPKLSPADIKQLMTFAHTLADAADKITLQHFRTPLEFDDKAPGMFDPVTKADRDAETAIRALIEQHHPTHGIIGEEFGNANPDADLVWVLDPIDGTRNFVSGLLNWGTLIGLTAHSKPLIGIMSQPYIDERYWADGSTSFHKHAVHEQVLTTRHCASLEEATIAASAMDMFNEPETQQFTTLASRCRLTRLGTDCHAYARLAAGQIDIVAEASLKPYDIMALIPIIETAGGVVTNWQGGAIDDTGQILALGDATLLDAAVAALRG